MRELINVSTVNRCFRIVGLLIAGIGFCKAECSSLARAQPTNSNEAQGEPKAEDDSKAEDDQLAMTQAQVAQRYKRLEELLIKSAEIEAASNPGRAALLQQAAQLGKQSQMTEMLARAAKSLEKKQYSQALDDQKISRESLKRLLELLQSENRQDRVREQREQVRRWIEETDRLRRLQSSLRGRTEGGQQIEKAASDQDKLANKAEEIAKELGATDKEPTTKSDPSPDSQSEKSEQPKGDPSKGDQSKGDQPKDEQPKGDKSKGEQSKGEQSKGEHSKGEQSKGEQSKGEQSKGEQSKGEQSKGEQSKGEQSKGEQSKGEQSKGEQSKGEQSKGEQSKGESSEGQKPKPQASPTERAAERIKQAQKQMREAEKRLKDAEREGAVEKQREAEQELQAAIEQLEEILRQLREEEIERSLAALEDRLRQMLQSQNKVLEETERLHEIAGEKADRQVEIRASNLSLDEKKILAEGQRALLLLRDEGTSAAFPEAMAQVLVDIESVVQRLGKADISKMTIAIEKEIVSSLEEMVEALVAVQKDQKDRKEQQPGQQPGQPGQPGEQPLVDKLAELRLIRTLQMRVNKRTQTLAEVLKDPNDIVGQSDVEDIQVQLKGLATRQSSIQQVTRDIVVGKTK